jgi:diacylglycerol kinase family enzyme
MWRLLSGRRVSDHRAIYGFRDAPELRCVSADGRPIPLQVDGEHIGDVTEAVFTVRPQALAVIA